MTRRHEYEPRLLLYMSTWLEEEINQDTVDDYKTTIFIRNIGSEIAFHPILETVSLPSIEKCHNHSRLYESYAPLGDEDELAIKPGDMITKIWGCKKEFLMSYKEDQKKHKYPFLVLSMQFYDIEGNLYNITQDYMLRCADNKLFKQYEYISTPTGTKSRMIDTTIHCIS